jgi:hypothetical protein
VRRHAFATGNCESHSEPQALVFGHGTGPIVAIGLVCGVIAFANTTAAETSTLFSNAKESVTTEELYEHVEVLADDVYEGRAAGSRGGRAAAQYLIKQLQKYQLSPAGTNGSFTQSFSDDWRNILALRPGSDPQLQDEVIVVGAHYDHVGYGTSANSYGPIGKIHNGADDNASGTAVLLEAIEAFATSGLRTRRSVLFAFWDGEENGLVGSRYWLAHPTLKLDRVKFAITIDMVGRLRKGQLYILGTRSGYGLRRLMSGPVEDPLWLDFTWELHDNSDHWSFLERRIPVALLHTGLHGDYHRPSDDVEKINRQGMREVSRYLVSVVAKAANEDRLPKFRKQARRDTDGMRRKLERPLEPASLANWPAGQPIPRLGLAWREDSAEPGTVFVIRVVEGTPAAGAGLRVRDRIHEVNGQTFADAAAFQSLIFIALEAKLPEITFLTERRGRVQTVAVSMPATGQDSKTDGQHPNREEREKEPGVR